MLNQLSLEFIFSLLSIIFLAGGYFSVLKKMEQKLKENDREIQTMITAQAVSNEKMTKIDEKINKMENQNLEIISLLTRRTFYEKSNT